MNRHACLALLAAIVAAAPAVAAPTKPAGLIGPMPATGKAVAPKPAVEQKRLVFPAAPLRPALQSAVDAAPLQLSDEATAIRSLLDGEVTATSKRGETLLAGVARFYRERRYEPVWLPEGRPTPQALSLVGRMGEAAEDGLDPDAYRHSLPDGPAPDPDALARAELKLSLTAARFIADLASGRFEPARVSPLVTPSVEAPDAADALARLSRAGNLDWSVTTFEPPHPQYHALKKALAALRAGPATEIVRVPEGGTLKPGDTDPRVAVLRERLGVATPEGVDPAFYDDTLFEAVGAFQSSHGLKADGLVGPRTVATINGAAEGPTEAELLANMERWRWLPRQLGAFHVFVNVPEFVGRISRDGIDVFETRVIVGSVKTPTPLFSDEMEHVVVNPYWNVPASILSKEMLPTIRANPSGYFQRHGYEVVATVKGKAQVVDPSAVDWWGGDLSKIRVRQPPGEANALGNLKFMFPNEHAVYLHDTASRSLFKRDARALSHGCVRVDDPTTFAEVVLMDEPVWTGDKVRGLIGGKERYVQLSNHIPVHLAYFTLRIEEDGTVRRFGDIYGYDAAVTKLIAPEEEPQT